MYTYILMFIYFRDKERKHEQVRGRERGRHRIGSSSRLRAIHPEPDAGLKLREGEIMT